MTKEQIVYKDGELTIMNPDARYVSCIRIPVSKSGSKNLIRQMSKYVHNEKCMIKSIQKIDNNPSASSKQFIEASGFIFIGAFKQTSLYIGKFDIPEIDALVVHAVNDNKSVSQVIISPKIHGYESNEEYLHTLSKGE